MKEIKTKHFFAVIMLVLFSTFALLSYATKDARALSLSSSLGGRILFKKFCTCSLNSIVYVGPPKGGIFIQQPGITKVYKNKNASSPNWVLGTTTAGSTCLMLAPNPFDPCVPIGGGPIIKMMGTS